MRTGARASTGSEQSNWMLRRLVLLVAVLTPTHGQGIIFGSSEKPGDGSPCDVGGVAGRCRFLTGCAPIRQLVTDKPAGYIFSLRNAANACQGPPLLCCTDATPSGNPDRNRVTSSPVILTSRPSTASRNSSPFRSPRDCGVSTFSPPRIVGGDPVPSKTFFPWMAALSYRTSGRNPERFRCGGALINDRWVLTASHCISSDGPISVTVRDLFLDSVIDDAATAPETVGVERVFKHPDFFRRGRMPVNDVALLKLDRALTFSDTLRPICINNQRRTVEDLTSLGKVYIAGWGYTEFGAARRSAQMMYAGINVTESSTCVNNYARSAAQIDPDIQLCAGGDDRDQPGCDRDPALCLGGVDSCRGDSGGPLMNLVNDRNRQRWEVIGIVSFGIGCGNPELPGVYARLDAFLDWIGQTVNNN